MTKPDPYVVLGVSRNDSDADIKKAYRRLRKKYHPDYNPNPDAPEHFRAVNDAYATLDARKETLGAGPEAYGAEAMDDYDMGSYDVYAAPKEPSAMEVLEKAIRELNSAYSAFRNRVLQMEKTLIPNAMAAYHRTDRARFVKDSASGGSVGFFKEYLRERGQ